MKVVLITGISSGFGLAIAQRLAMSNYKVYGTVRRETEHIPGVNYLYMNVVSSESVIQAVDNLYQKEGRIDVLINNAGMGVAAPLELAALSDIHNQLNVNFLGAVRVTQAVLPIMRRQAGGLIISISSIGGLIGLPFQGYYSASKFALEGFCQALYHEVKPFNIKVVIVNPGDFATSFTSNRKIPDMGDILAMYPTSHNAMSVIEHDEQNGLQPEVLSIKIERIIRKRNPSPRYVIASPLQKASVFLKQWLPERVFLWMIGKYYHIG